MSREALGEFEQLVLLAIIRLTTATDAGDVYGVPIVEEIEARTRRKVSRAAVYIALRRLEHKGLVATWMGAPTQERGGKSRRCVKVTRTGIQMLRESRQALNEMWRGLDPRPEKIR
ncbi:MAG TPA: helix-turn-helix transcriptional regulator [Vicinamibacterales bacterium]|nr:helix-turn-helix transcriptional regulator [Vicinamibacterales bacterium]